MGLALAIDNLIGILSPRKAAERVYWRNRRQAMELRSYFASTYGAAERNRLSSDMRDRQTSADSAILGDRETLNARARRAVRENAAAKSIRRSFQRRVVGGWGVTPCPIVMQADGKTPDDKFNETAFREFMRWACDPRNCDVEGKKSLAAIERMAIGEAIEVGEHMIVWSYDQAPDPRYPHGGGPVRLKLQCFEPEQFDLTVSKADNGNEIRAGIEVDQLGRAVAYHFLARHPFDYQGVFSSRAYRSSLDTIRIPAEQVFHIFEQDRVLQSHGVTRYHAVLKRMHMLLTGEETSLIQWRMQACVGVLENSDDGSDMQTLLGGSDDDGEDSDGNAEVVFQPGMYFKGKDLKPFTPNCPGPQYEAFVEKHNEAIGAGTGLGYGQVTMDFTRTNYSGQRQETIEGYGEIDIWEELLITQFLQPLWQVFIDHAILEGKLQAPSIEERGNQPIERLYACEWRGPQRPWIDPEKEINAHEKAILLGVSSRKRVLAELGYDVKSTFAQLAEEKQLAEAAGIEVGGSAAATAQAKAKSDAESGGDGSTGTGRKTTGKDKTKSGRPPVAAFYGMGAGAR